MRRLLRFRAIVLLCSVVAGLLAICCQAFWALLEREAALNLTDTVKLFVRSPTS
jgi:hypothetical protein